MSPNQSALLYLIASVLFILALKGLSHPRSARRGNLFGIIGMALAVVTTLTITRRIDIALGMMALGGAIGLIVAKRVQMTQMPELVAAMHSLVGMAAVLIAAAVVSDPLAFGLDSSIPVGNRLELFIGTFVGAITFSGSIIAFGKLAGLGKYGRIFSSAPVTFPGQHIVNLILALVMIACGVLFVVASTEAQWTPFVAMTGLAFVLGILVIIPIGGADMPVVISMLNSYSGWAAAGIGFSLNNSLLIIAGALVGSSGAILSYIMCRAMNRSFFSVVLGGFGGAEGEAATDTGQKTVKSGSADDVAFLLGNAESVIIVPGSLIVAGALLLVTFDPGTIALVTIGVMLGVGASLVQVGTNVFAIDISPRGSRGRFFGQVQAAMHAASFIGPAAVGGIADYAGFSAAFVVLAMFFAFVTFVGIAMARYRVNPQLRDAT